MTTPIARIRKKITKLDEKKIVGLLVVTKNRKGVESDYVVYGGNDEHLATSKIFLDAGIGMMKKLIKDGVVEIDNNSPNMYR